MRIRFHLRKRWKGENVSNHRKHPGAPDHHITSARKGRTAKGSIPRSDFARKNRREAMSVGFFFGLALGLAILAAAMLLWAIPTVEAVKAAVA